MSGARGWQQAAIDALFLAAEAFAWYIVLHAGATAMEQTSLTQLEDHLRVAAGSLRGADAALAAEALAIVRRAVPAEHGPALPIVFATAFGAFGVMRGTMRARFEGALGGAVLLAASIVALNLLVRLAIVGDLRVWDTGGLAAALAGGGVVGSAAAEAFIRHPDSLRVHGATINFVVVAMVAMWVRFLLAGRDRVTFERVQRSFTIGFLVTIAGIAFAAAEGIGRVQVVAVPQFTCGVLALAVANHARTTVPVDGPRRIGPWLAAVGGTVSVLIGVALLIAALAFLGIGSLLGAIGAIAWQVIAFVLIVVLTPVLWVVEHGLRLFIGPEGLHFPNVPDLLNLVPPEAQEANQARGWGIPMWAQQSLKFLAVLAILFVAYRLAIILLRRRRPYEPPVDEVRGQASAGVSLGGMLRAMFPGGRRHAGDEWLRREPIYRLYARAAHDAEDRGFVVLPGETPLEFAARADRAMAAPAYPPIAEAFDRARYGRHLPEEAAVRSMEGTLAAWEAATPPTEELRHRLAGSGPLSEAQEIRLRIAERRRGIARNNPRRPVADAEEEGPPI